jgi:hypothetical protein
LGDSLVDGAEAVGPAFRELATVGVQRKVAVGRDPPSAFEGRVALDEVLNRFPDWEVDWANARRAHTSTVRGWESLPVAIR